MRPVQVELCSKFPDGRQFDQRVQLHPALPAPVVVVVDVQPLNKSNSNRRVKTKILYTMQMFSFLFRKLFFKRFQSSGTGTSLAQSQVVIGGPSEISD